LLPLDKLSDKGKIVKMIKIEFLGPIGTADMEIEASTLGEVGAKLQEIESLKPWLANSAVALNDSLVGDKNTPLKDGDRVSILPPVCGG